MLAPGLRLRLWGLDSRARGFGGLRGREGLGDVHVGLRLQRGDLLNLSAVLLWTQVLQVSFGVLKFI